MNSIILAIAKALNPVIDYIILAAFLGVLIWLLSINKEIKLFHIECENALYGKKRKRVQKTGIQDFKTIEEADTLRSDYYGLEEKFDTINARYESLSSIIPIFPLLGILGTVSGLMEEVLAADVNAILTSLTTALTSTFCGLLAVIILKAIESLCTQKEISKVSSILEIYSIKYEDVIERSIKNEDDMQ